MLTVCLFLSISNLSGMMPPVATAQQIEMSTSTATVILPNAPGRGLDQVSGTDAHTVDSSPSITGVVVDIHGDPILNAQITLAKADFTGGRIVETDAHGSFCYSGLTPGSYRITIVAPGMETFVSPELLLAISEHLDLPQTTLLIATANTDVQVTASRDQVAAAQVQLAEKQRVFGIVPNFYSSYIWDAEPLTPKLKFDLALRSTADPVTFLITGGLAGVEQAHNTFPGYGSGPQAYAKRYAAAYADNLVGRMIGSALLPIVFRQDPRYFYKGRGSVSSRALYAIGATFIARGDNGQSEPNYSHILGNFAAAAISNAYRSPVDRNPTLTLRNGLIITGSNAIANLVREFLLRKITSQVPAYEQGKP